MLRENITDLMALRNAHRMEHECLPLAQFAGQREQTAMAHQAFVAAKKMRPGERLILPAAPRSGVSG